MVVFGKIAPPFEYYFMQKRQILLGFWIVLVKILIVWSGRLLQAGLKALSASCLAFSALSMAATFTAGIEKSQWYLSSSIFECALVHDIPYYGRATFYHEAGENLKFFLDASVTQMRPGKAALVIEAPKWRPGSAVRDLGLVAVSGQTRPVNIGSQHASQMIDGLLAGMQPTFTRRAKYNQDTVRVEVSSVNFSKIPSRIFRRKWKC